MTTAGATAELFAGTETGGPLAPALTGPPQRALVLAGGGLKVAFQAGVLQVWLDEALDDGQPLRFVHADGASGGVFNLAMWCQGMSGQRIAENWRRFTPLRRGLPLNWRGLHRLESVFTMDRFRTDVLRDTWGLDWRLIRATDRSASFNLFDVDAQRLVTLPPSAMSEDLMIAGVALPFWYPPVRADGHTYIDAVFVTDANLTAAIAAGADELWVPWTVSTAGRWRGGPVAQYFQVIEACANGSLRRELDRIAASNLAWAQGRPAEFPHPVRVVPLQAEVPVHYLFVFTRRQLATAVDLGVAHARRWCVDRGFELGTDHQVRALTAPGPAVRFHERMSGPVAFGTPTTEVGAELGDARGDRMTLRLLAEIDDVEAFRAEPGHHARLSGSVECAVLGGTLPVERGSLSLLPGAGAGRASTMEYRLDVADRTGRELTLVGVKTVRDDPGLDLWSDTTTLDVRLFPRDGVSLPDPPLLSGRLRLTVGSFLRMLTTVRGGDRRPVVHFATFFLRRLADIYLLGPRPVRTQSPAGSAFDGWPAGEEPQRARVFAHNERIVPAPPERVWELLIDAHGWSDYYPNALLVDVDGPGRPVLRRGTIFRWVTFGLPITSRVDLAVPHRRLGWYWRGLGAHGYHVWMLEPDEHGTRIVTEETQRGILPWLLRPVLRRVLPIGHDLWLRRLARRASRPASRRR